VVQVRGFADQQPKVKDDPADPSNRRVSVIVRYQKPQPAPEKSESSESHEKPEKPRE